MPRLTPEQVAERRTFIGASDIGAIAGLNPFKDAFDVLNEKLGYSEEQHREATDSTEIGHRLEPVIRDLYREDQNVTLIPCGTVRHPKQTWAGATLDSKIQGLRRGLEIKAVGHRMVFDWDPGSDDGIPHYVRAQAAWQMWIVELDEIDVAALLGGTSFKVWRIARDVQLEEFLVATGYEFYSRHVLEQTAPTLTGGESVRTYLDGKYPPPPAPVQVMADEDVSRAVLTREVCAATVKESAMFKDKATAEIIEWLGQHSATDIIGPDWEFRYRVRKDGGRQPWFQRKGAK